jgi:DNA polymerase-3 subunit alpha
MLMHTIFCCKKGEKKRPIGRIVAIGTFCLIRNTISRQGRDEKTLYWLAWSDLEYRKSWIKLKYTIWRGVLPKFDIRGVFVAEDTVDGGVRGENAYLRHLTYEGANRRYPKLQKDQELFLNYWPFLTLVIWADCTGSYCRSPKYGFSGRTRAWIIAGSVVAYCLKITTLPLMYNLFFERFLNPIVSLPDIDIDLMTKGEAV